MPSPVDLVELPFLREALAEVVLLALAGGLVGAWVILRRLAFYSHAVGSATFPGLVTADATGLSPTLLALAVALGYAGGVGGARRTGEDSEAATALLLVAALALGVVLASDVFESGAGVDRLLFGTLLGLDGSDLAALRRLRGRGRSRPPSRSAAPGRAIGFDPDARPRARPARRARGPGAAGARGARRGRGASRRWGRCWWARCSCCPAPRRGWSPAAFPALLAWAVALALAEGLLGLYLAYWLDAPPGPPIAVLGARRLRRAGARRGARGRGARGRHA